MSTPHLPAADSGTAALIDRLDRADQLPGATALRERSYELLRMPPGRLVVDVGCGTGRAVGELRARGHEAVGLDPAEEMISAARTRWPAARFQLGDAYQLPFADGEVAGYRSDKVFHLLDDPALALREARRVLAPDGRIVLVGQDWDTLLIDADDPALTRTIVHARADRLASPFAARRFRTSLLDSGFADVSTEVQTLIATDENILGVLSTLADHARMAGVITEGQAEAWVGEQRARAEAGRLFVVVAVIVAAASRTGSS
jgi:ubiquinone/menaquinone biosynthesis C-methylase UbiE